MEEELWVLAGFAGHGVMHGPVLAELLARTMLGDPDQTVDLEPCNPLRTPQRSFENEWMATPIRERSVTDELSKSRETN
jgi:hypothetical protein